MRMIIMWCNPFIFHAIIIFMMRHQIEFLIYLIYYRTSRRLWETRVSPNVLYSMHHLLGDKSTLVIGGIDGVLRTVDQNSGEVLSRLIMEEDRSISNRSKAKNGGVIERKKAVRLSEDDRIDLMPNRPPISCLAVGMQKVVTTHNDRYIRVWRFGNKWRNFDGVYLFWGSVVWGCVGFYAPCQCFVVSI